MSNNFKINPAVTFRGNNFRQIHKACKSLGEQLEKNQGNAFIQLTENISLDTGKYIGSDKYYVSFTNKGRFGTTFQNIITGSLETLKKQFGEDCRKTAKFIEAFVDSGENSVKVSDKYSKTVSDFKQSMK